MIVPIAPVVSKNFETNWDDWWFPYNHLGRLKDKRRVVVSDVPGSDNPIFARVSQTSQT